MSTLPLFPSKAPKVSDDELRWMLWVLRGKGWMPAARLATPVMPDRKLRAIAAASQGQIISGQQGYRLTAEASITEVQHAADWLRHQSAAMARRASEIERAMHQRPAQVQEIAS